MSKDLNGRHERHLMRQRGAGTRVLPTTFGFTFNATQKPVASSTNPKTPAKTPAKQRNRTPARTPARAPARTPARIPSRNLVAQEAPLHFAPRTQRKTPRRIVSAQSQHAKNSSPDDATQRPSRRVQATDQDEKTAQVVNRQSHTREENQPEPEPVDVIEDAGARGSPPPLDDCSDIDLVVDEMAPMSEAKPKPKTRKKRKPVTMPKKRKAPAKKKAIVNTVQNDVGTTAAKKQNGDDRGPTELATTKRKRDVQPPSKISNSEVVGEDSRPKKREKTAEGPTERKLRAEQQKGDGISITSQVEHTQRNAGMTAISRLQETKGGNASKVVDKGAHEHAERRPLAPRDSNTPSPKKTNSIVVSDEGISVKGSIRKGPAETKGTEKNAQVTYPVDENHLPENDKISTKTPEKGRLQLAEQRRMFSIKDADDDGEVWFRAGKRKAKAK